MLATWGQEFGDIGDLGSGVLCWRVGVGIFVILPIRGQDFVGDLGFGFWLFGRSGVGIFVILAMFCQSGFC